MIRAIEFYSGIGGLHLALQRSGVNARVVRAFDWDPAASLVYTENFGKDIVRRVDIAQLTAADLSALDAPLWLLSPACQPYTVLNPSARGSADPRAKSFLHLIENVLPDLAMLGLHPHWILIENVSGFEVNSFVSFSNMCTNLLSGHTSKSSSTRQILLTSLQGLGYLTAEFLLTPLQFSIPNSRLRYYLLAKISSLTFAGMSTTGPISISRSIPGCGTDWIDPRQSTPSHLLDHQCYKLSHFLDKPQGPEYWQAFAVPDKVLQKKGVLFDIVLPKSRRTCCFTRGYTHMVEGTSILQMNEELDATTTFDAYAASVAKPPANSDANPVRILHALQLRYFTPDELLRLFHFLPTPNEISPDLSQCYEFRWPSSISLKTKYRLIGNSVNVKVVQTLISYLFNGDASVCIPR